MALSFATSSHSAWVPPGFVTRIGTRLYLDGVPYRFTGLNIYNASSINNCWYTMGTGTTLEDSLSAIGPGQNAFRAWFFQSLAVTRGLRDWTAFDHTLAVAKARHQKVIATLAGQGGGCEDNIYKDITWYRQGYRTVVSALNTQTYRDYVKAFVTRYKDDPTILAYQFMSEAEALPSAGGLCDMDAAAAALATFAADMGRVTKGIDPYRLTNLGT